MRVKDPSGEKLSVVYVYGKENVP